MTTYPVYYVKDEKHTMIIQSDEEHGRAKDIFAQYPEWNVRPATEDDPTVAEMLKKRKPNDR